MQLPLLFWCLVFRRFVQPIPFVNTLPWMILCAARPPYILNRANACPHFGQCISPWVWSSAMRSTMHFTNRPRPPLRYLYSRLLHFAQRIEMVRMSLRAMGKSSVEGFAFHASIIWMATHMIISPSRIGKSNHAFDTPNRPWYITPISTGRQHGDSTIRSENPTY